MRTTLTVLSLALCSTACGSSDSGGAPTGPASLDFGEFDKAMTKFVADKTLRGASAVIVDKDRGIVHTAGYGEFKKDRVYLVMSSSKILSVGVLMRLADQGKLDVDAPIGNYVSAWGSGKQELTAGELVSGSSGLVGIVDNLAYAPYACQGDATLTLSDCAKTLYTTVDDAADRKQPDTEFHYGGAPWQLAGGVAEVAGGKAWSDLIRETYEPCDVPSMGYTNATSLISITLAPDGTLAFGGIGYPQTVDGDSSGLPVTDNPSIEGGLYTNVEDYGKLLLMHLRGGTCEGTRILSEKAVSAMQTDRVAAYGGSTEDQMRAILTGADDAALNEALNLSGYGMGWWVNRKEPGVFADPGAFGSLAWLDTKRGYGGFIAIEGNVLLGADVGAITRPVVEATFDAAAK